MAKFNDIRELAQQNARWVSNSPKDWMNYLDVAARLYRYSFKDGCAGTWMATEECVVESQHFFLM